jgi:hypothetical protein
MRALTPPNQTGLNFRRSCRGQGTATQRSYCTSSTIDLPPRGRQRARVSVCFARAEYIDVMLMPAGSSLGTRCMVKVNEPFNESTW